MKKEYDEDDDEDDDFCTLDTIFGFVFATLFVIAIIFFIIGVVKTYG